MSTYRHQKRASKAVAEALSPNLRADPAGSVSSVSIDMGIDTRHQNFSNPFLEQSGILASTSATPFTPNRKPQCDVSATGRDVDANRGKGQGHKEALYRLYQSSGGA